MARDDAYRLVQERAQRAWQEGKPFQRLLGEQLAATADAPAGVAEQVAKLDWSDYLTHVPEVLERLEALRKKGSST